MGSWCYLVVGRGMANTVERKLKLPPGVHCLVVTVDCQVYGSGSAQQANRSY